MRPIIYKGQAPDIEFQPLTAEHINRILGILENLTTATMLIRAGTQLSKPPPPRQRCSVCELPIEANDLCFGMIDGLAHKQCADSASEARG